MYAFEFLLILRVYTIQKVYPPKILFGRCKNVINFEVVSKNSIMKDSSLNVYRQTRISFEDRVVVEKTSINQYGAGPRRPKIGRVDNFRNRRI